MRIYIDMDHTICDFASAHKVISTNSIIEKHRAHPQSKKGFFINLEPIEGAIESIKELAIEHDVWFLSRPSFRNIHSYSEKAQWILNHLGYEMQTKLILCGDKSLVKGDLLIDDHTRDGQLQFEGKFMQFGSVEYPTWKVVMEKIKALK